MKKRLFRLLFAHYNILLSFLFLLFIFRPYNYGETYTGIWKTFLTLTLIVAIFNCNHATKTKIIISLVAIPVIVLTWLNLNFQTLESYVITSIFTSVFMLICAGSIIQDVLVHPKVNLETLRGLICAYFLVAFLFAYIYFFTEYLRPGTMLIDAHPVTIANHPHFFSDMLYFSFVTLLTIGYGDIVPVHEWGQTAAVVEGIIGQFYIAILVARIVAVYTFVNDKKLIKTMTKKN